MQLKEGKKVRKYKVWWESRRICSWVATDGKADWK